MKLYELTEAYAELLSRLEDCQSAQEESEVLAAIDAVSEDIAAKGEAYARIIRNKLAEVAGYEAEIKRMQARRNCAKNTINHLKGSLLFAMGIVGATELNTTIGKWKIQKNPPSVVILDESKIPDKFTVHQPPKIMNSAILQHFSETGEIPEGCDVVQSEGVRFR
jgi:hypothetical protein